MATPYENQQEYFKYAANAFTGFNEFITTQATPIIDLKSIYGISALRDKVDTTGSGTVTTERGLYKVATGATASSSARLTSVEYGRYVAGFEATPGVGILLSRMPNGNEVATWGYYDDNDGFGWGVDAQGMFTFKRSGGVELRHRPVDWLNNDKPIDLDRLNIYRNPFRWYGSGPVRYEVSYTDESGKDNLRQIDYFRSTPGEPLTENPNLPIRVDVTNGGDTTDFFVFVGGRQFFVQGDYNPNRRITSEHRIEQSVGTSFVPLVSWQQKPGFESVSVKLDGIQLQAQGASIIYQVRVGVSLTGATFTGPSDIPVSETALQFDDSATAFSGGQKIYEGLVAAGSGNDVGASSATVPFLDISKDVVVTVCARSVSGTATVTSVLKAREEW